MHKQRVAIFIAALVTFVSISILCDAQTTPSNLPVSISVYNRTRVDAWQWFAAPPESETYGYLESLIRVSVAQKLQHWDWLGEVAQPSLIGLPKDAVSPVTAQGQLGLGGTYYAYNGNNNSPAGVFLKQGFLRHHFSGKDQSLRVGRFEFFEGVEMQPEDATIAWLQTNRIQQRLIGNFGFSNAQRSFDGADAHYGRGDWDITGMAARSDQGVYNMNGNPQLNVDLQYLAFTRTEFHGHLLWRAFGSGYHDGRTGIVKTDNRPLAVRQADHKNIRLGTYGGDLVASAPAGPGKVDFLFWGALQNGQWGLLNQRAGAYAVEGGYQLSKVATTPWLRGGAFQSSGDNNPADKTHNTFFQILPTARVYARFPFYNLMNSQDQFVQIIDRPAKRLELRSDLHWLQLTSGKDLWYSGGGAFDNKVFGYTGRPVGGHSSFASLADVSADWQAGKTVALNFYYGHAWGKTAIGSIYPSDRNAQFGYAEVVYRWGLDQRPAGR